jgi:hypothetical protein
LQNEMRGRAKMEGLITTVRLRRARKPGAKRRYRLRGEAEAAGDGSEIRVEDSFVLLRFCTEPWRDRNGLEDSGG